MRVMSLDRGDLVIRRDAIDDVLQGLGSSYRAAITKSLNKVSVKAARYVIIGEYEGEPVLLPTDRRRYKDKHHDPRLAKLNPLEFFKSVYHDLPKDGVVYAKDLGKVDA